MKFNLFLIDFTYKERPDVRGKNHGKKQRKYAEWKSQNLKVQSNWSKHNFFNQEKRRKTTL